MMNSIESYLSNYELYMEQVSYHQQQMNRYIQECICLETGDIKGLEFLNEGVLDSIKNTIEKIIESVKKFFARFKETFDKTFSNDQTYLSDYKDIILQKQVTIDFTDYFEYDLKLFTTDTPIPKFAYEEMHKNGYLKDEDTFIAQYFPKFVDKSKDFSDNVKYILQGKEPTPSKEGKTINMKDLYNFCYEYKKIREILESEQKALDNARTDSYNIISKKSAEYSTPTDNTENKEEEGEENKQKNEQQESVIMFSNVYNRYITESFVQEITVANSKSSSDGAKASSIPNSPNEKESVAKNLKTSTGRRDEDLSKSTDATDLETLKDEINVYFSICGAMLTTKLNVALDIYKQSMFVIREHVRSIVGTDDANSVNKGIDTPTIYTTRIDDEAYSKLNESEKKEYETAYNTFKDEYVKYWQKSPKGVQYYRLDISKKGEEGWIKVENVVEDEKKAFEAFKQARGEGYNAYEKLKEIYKKIGYTGDIKYNQSTNISQDDKAVKNKPKKQDDKNQGSKK